MTTIRQLISLKGRRVLLTGAAGNLGRVMADALAELEADLLLVDRQEPALKTLAEDLSGRWGTKVGWRVCDLEQQAQRSDLMAWIASEGKGLNVLINNAAFVGTSELQGWAVPFEEQTVETWRRAMEVNLATVFDLCRGLTPLLKAAKSAGIVNIASIYGVHGPDWRLYEGANMGNPAAYAASKGGLIQFTRWLATTLAPQVRVNAISPGGIFRNQPVEFVERYSARTPLGRMATEDDLRGAIAYLSSDLSAYVTGQNLTVDGGWGTW